MVQMLGNGSDRIAPPSLKDSRDRFSETDLVRYFHILERLLRKFPTGPHRGIPRETALGASCCQGRWRSALLDGPPTARYGLKHRLLGQAPLLAGEADRELKGVSPLPLPHVGLHGRPSQRLGRGYAMVAVCEKQFSVDVEDHDGGGFVEVLDVVRHPVRVQMWAAPLDRVAREPGDGQLHNRHAPSLGRLRSAVHGPLIQSVNRTAPVAARSAASPGYV